MRLRSASDVIEKALFFIFLIVFPFQYRKIFYSPGWQFQEWQSYSLYATDLLILGLVGFWLFRLGQSSTWRFSFDLVDSLLVLGLLVALISVTLAINTGLAWYSLGRLAVGAIIFWYARYYAVRRFNLTDALLALVFGGFFQAIVAIGQFVFQSDLGLRYLGEGLLNPQTPGVAVFHDWFGEKIMRAYGTTPHPNILAVCLLISLSALWGLWYLFRDYMLGAGRYILYFFTPIVLIGFWLTFSRTAIFVWVILWAVGLVYLWFFSRPQAKQIFWVTLISAGFFLALWWPETLSRVFISSQEEAVQLRVYFAEESIKEPANIAGIGIGNFVPWLMERNPYQPLWRYQPVHNLYLLIFTELGWLGVASFGLFFAALVRQVVTSVKHLSPLAFVGVFLAAGLAFIALFDHLFWTLQQGRIVWWAGLGLLAGVVNKLSNRRVSGATSLQQGGDLSNLPTDHS